MCVSLLRAYMPKSMNLSSNTRSCSRLKEQKTKAVLVLSGYLKTALIIVHFPITPSLFVPPVPKISTMPSSHGKSLLDT
jgi:hypothetical protein